MQIVITIISFLFSGILGSYLVAKFVINKTVETKMKTLSSQVKNNEVEKKRFLNNLLWVLENYGLALQKNSSDFKTREEWEAYKIGAADAIKARQIDIFNRLSYGIEETNSMFEDDWTKEN